MTRAPGDGRPRPVVALRPAPGLDPGAPLPPSDERLLARIVTSIRTDGPMPFARFMTLALYDPEGGYYATGPGGPGGDGGDYLTAPEGHPIFGWTIATQLAEVWDRLGRPARFVVREHGAGRGALAAAILDGLRRDRAPLFDAIRYQAADAAPARLAALRERLAGLGLGDRLEDADEVPAPGAILANELLDALPVHALEGGPDGTLLERFVVLDPAGRDGLGWATGEPSTGALAERLDADGVVLAPGQRAEVCLGIDAWLAAAVAPLERGLVLLIDYGHPAEALYAPSRGSLLRAYHRHRVHGDPLVAVGRQDLTAHVDLTAVERAAAAAGLTVLGRTTQAEFLGSLGIVERLVALQAGAGAAGAGGVSAGAATGAILAEYLAARAAVVRMLDPGATGRFAALLFGRGLDPAPPLRGLSFRLAAAATGR